MCSEVMRTTVSFFSVYCKVRVLIYLVIGEGPCHRGSDLSGYSASAVLSAASLHRILSMSLVRSLPPTRSRIASMLIPFLMPIMVFVHRSKIPLASLRYLGEALQNGSV